MDFPLNQGLLNVKTKFDFLISGGSMKDIKMANCNISMSIPTSYSNALSYTACFIYIARACTVPSPAVLLPISTTANRTI